MQELDDISLLRQYTERNSEDAFAVIVARHVNKVYSVALRYSRNSHQAEEITQAVFVVLAKKAHTLNSRVILSGWLYETARLTAMTFIRSEIRRARREQEAHMQNVLNENESDVWPQIAPLLDSAVAGLSSTDKHAIVLRYFDGKSTNEVGVALGVSEDAAKMRLSRAVEKLRRFFTKRGILVPSAVLTSAIAANSVQAAPATLAQSATAVAFAKAATSSTSTLTLVKGALKIMAWTKAKSAIVVVASVLLAAGTATVVVKEITAPRGEGWQKKYDLSGLGKVRPQATILPAIPSRPGGSWGNGSYGLLGLGVRAMDVLQCAYGGTLGRMIFSAPIPDGSYDFISNIQNPRKALQQEIRNKFGLSGRRQLIETNVLVLTVRTRNAAGLKPSSVSGKGGYANRDRSTGSYQCTRQPILNLVEFLEDYLGTPVVDRTGLTGAFDLHLVGDSTPEGLKHSVFNELGLELVPTHDSIEYLIIEKAN